MIQLGLRLDKQLADLEHVSGASRELDTQFLGDRGQRAGDRFHRMYPRLAAAA
jgi:hypothetical protein